MLSFLDEQAEKSRKAREGHQGPAGELQVIVATHSPNFSAWVESKKLIFFRSFLPRPANLAAAAAARGGRGAAAASRCAGRDDARDRADPVLPVGRPRRFTRCIPLAALALNDVERRKVDRYLDVTKSALLFGGRVLLAEGIAEALLLPVIAKKIMLREDVEKLRLFRSAVLVPIDGVDFEPYTKLLLSPYEDVRIADRLVVLTDGDGGEVAAGTEFPGVARKRKLDAVAKGLGAADLLDVVINDYSLETELVRAGNAELLKQVYLVFHPQSGDKWDAAVAQTDAAQAVAIQKLFESTRKGDFAQLLAEEIIAGKTFTVPPYLQARDRGLGRMTAKVFAPTDEQARIIGHAGSAFIAACPGAGKTRVMVERARQLLGGRPTGRGIAFLSFTVAAVSELEDRLRREGLVETPAFPHFIGTFDAFLWQYLIAPFGVNGCMRRPRLIPDKDDRPIQPFEGAQALPLECFDRVTGAAIPAKLQRYGFRWKIKAHETAARNTRRRLLEQGELDFTDAREIAVARLRDPTCGAVLGPAFAARFQELIVDEAQDCNPVIWKSSSGSEMLACQ